MNIIERPLPAGNKFNKPKLIVIHAMGEYIDLKSGPKFAPDFLEDINYPGDASLSAHVLGVPNGDVMVCRRTDQGAYHASGYNTDSLGYEFLVSGVHNYGTFLEAIKTDYVTQEQWLAGIEMVSSWCKEFDIDPYDSRDHHGVKRHSDISPERKVDPGEGFDWEKFKSNIKS